MCKDGNWVLNVFISLCFFKTLQCQPCELDGNSLSSKALKTDWPCSWGVGSIPYVFNFFSVSPKRLINLVTNGLEYLTKRSCLQFEEHNPITMAEIPNATYLYYTYSGVLESCCLKFYSKPVGRRVILITPTCTLPAEVAHVTLHGLGLGHTSRTGFVPTRAKTIMFPEGCPNRTEKLKLYGLLL